MHIEMVFEFIHNILFSMHQERKTNSKVTLIVHRYSLLLHHNEEQLRDFGLTDEMLIDQEW